MPVPSLLRGFSAPVMLDYDYTEAELAFLAANDSDPVNRWDAAQRAFVRAMLSLAEDHRGKRALSVPPALLQVVRALLADREHDPALIALALALPDVAYVAALTETIDVDGIVAARNFLVAALARALRAEFADAYGRHRVGAPYAPTTEQTGRRKLANACLSYLCATEDHEARAMAVAHFGAREQHDRRRRRPCGAEGP